MPRLPDSGELPRRTTWQPVDEVVDDAKGYGFIERTMQRTFVHYSATGEGYRSLTEAPPEFDVEQTPYARANVAVTSRPSTDSPFVWSAQSPTPRQTASEPRRRRVFAVRAD